MNNPTAASERLLYPNLSTVNEQYINDILLEMGKQTNKQF